MYLENIKIENNGPIENVSIDCEFFDNGGPKPLVFVGPNGSGKSIAIANIVNAMAIAQSLLFEDSDVEKGKVYKLRAPTYIRHGAEFSTSSLGFSDGFELSEIQLAKPKKEFKETLPEYQKWDSIKDDEISHFHMNFNTKLPELKRSLNHTTNLYFPPNRFEEPAWLNYNNLNNKVNYGSLEKFTTFSNRPIVNYSPMHDLQSWLLDLIYDSYAIERRLIGNNFVRAGLATSMLNTIAKFLNILFSEEGLIEWQVGSRNSRSVGIKIDGKNITDNLFQLSTGQILILDMFLSIMRDFDLSHSNLTKLADVKGIVIVDEIDLHLHLDMQLKILPKLLKLFPNVQFILTTHSPLFLLGMKNEFTESGFQLIEMPDGKAIEVERYSEFEVAFNQLQESVLYQNQLTDMISKSHRPIIHFEGSTDIKYVTAAAKHLDEKELLEKFNLVDAEGCRRLDKMWSAYNLEQASSLSQVNILLYDCDVGKNNEAKGKVYLRVIPSQEGHMIRRGIENLFSDETILKAKKHKVDFIDVIGEHIKEIRGVKNSVKEQWEINKDEKSNMCNWICENSTKDDFVNFKAIFNILRDILEQENAD